MRRVASDAVHVTAVRVLCALMAAAAIGGCASAPVGERETVKVDAGTISRDYSSFNARVLSESIKIENTFTASLSTDVEAVTRLDSAYTQRLGDAEDLRVGDTVSSAGSWGNAVRFGGMQFGTRSAGRADVIASTQLAASGVAVLPTVADALFASMGDARTPLGQQHLSVDRSWRGDGPGVLGLIARDSFGRSAAIDAPIVAATKLAERGCEDFSVGVGKVRRDYAITSNEYGPLFANTTVACGAPLGFTIEGHGEFLADDVTALGVSVARRVGALGTASVAIASSRADLGSGWLTRVGFEHQNPLFSVLWKSRYQTREFREVGSVSAADPIMQRDLASVGLNLSPGSTLSLAYATQTTWSHEKMNLIALKKGMTMGRGSLSMSASHSLVDNFGSSLFISYQRPFGLLRVTRTAIEEFDIDALSQPIAQ
jgi:outer membrane usher protein FimD/PapC